MARVAIIGGTGFIGRHMAAALTQAGHEVQAFGRARLDLAQADAAQIRAALSGVAHVIVAAGLARDQAGQSMAALHQEGPERLFAAAADAGVRQVIFLSALGADPNDATGYQSSKGKGEAALRAHTRLIGRILRPSLVIGRGGFSTGLFCALAALPLPIRLGEGDWRVQPVAVADLAALAVRLVNGDAPEDLRDIDVVGPEPMTTDMLTSLLRGWLGLPARRPLPIPAGLLRLSARLGGALRLGPIDGQTLSLLERGNVGDPSALTQALGRPPQRLADALAAAPAAPADRIAARLFWARAPLRLSLALFWIATCLTSIWLYPRDKSYALLTPLGLSGGPADIAIWAGGLLDLLLGVLLLIGWRPALVGAMMLGSVATFSLLCLGLPWELWTHPFGPILKNLPIAAAVGAMMALEA